MQLQKPEPLQHPPLPVDALVTLEVGGGEVSQLSMTPCSCWSTLQPAGCHCMSQMLSHIYIHDFHFLPDPLRLRSFCQRHVPATTLDI